MTGKRPQPRRRSETPTRRTQPTSPREDVEPKPYQLISLPQQPPKRDKPAGQDKFQSDRLSGKMALRLTVKTTAFVASGVMAMGDDVPNQTKSIPLIKTAVQGDQKLIVPGSSLKGVVRSTYEAITQSCLCKVMNESKKRNWIPTPYRECTVDPKKNRLAVCPACQVFGAMGWQGLIHFTDARCERSGFSLNFMRSLYSPQPEPKNKQTREKFLNSEYFNSQGKVRGRKFYYHAIRAVDSGDFGVHAQQAGREYTFTTQVQFANLTQAELGTLAIALGQDSQNPIALKVGGGKPIGMGTMTVEVTEIELIRDRQGWRDRYSSYESQPESLTGAKLQQFVQQAIQSAHRQLVQAQQMQELKQVLQWPTDREPPEGMY